MYFFLFLFIFAILYEMHYTFYVICTCLMCHRCRCYRAMRSSAGTIQIDPLRFTFAAVDIGHHIVYLDFEGVSLTNQDLSIQKRQMCFVLFIFFATLVFYTQKQCIYCKKKLNRLDMQQIK